MTAPKQLGALCLKDIAIIGGGIVGLVCARNLARKGYKVCVFSSETSASSVAPGINSLKGIFIGNTPLFKRKIAGHGRLWDELASLEEETSKDLGLSKIVLEPFVSQKELLEFSDRAYHGRFWGLFGTEVVARHSDFNGLNEQFIGALKHREDFSFDPVRALQMLEQSLVSMHCKIVEMKVKRFSYSNRKFSLHLENGYISQFEDLIIAAGASSPQILNDSGLFMDGFKWKAGISLVAESSLNVRLKRKQKSLASRDHSLRYGAQDFSVNNYMDLFTFKQENRYKITESFETLVNSLFEFTAQFDHPRLLVGVRLNGPKNLPIIERLDFNEGKGPILATGFHRSGWSLAWEAGDLVAEILQK